MRRYGRRDPMDRFFDVVPYIFMIMFVVGVIWMIVQFAVIGYIGYSVISDPQGSAQFFGEIASEAIKPVVNTIEENQ